MAIRNIVEVLDFAPKHWSASTRLIALIIADHVDIEQKCWPSLRRLQERSGLSRRQVQRILIELEASGAIERVKRYENNRQTSNLYLWKSEAFFESDAIVKLLRSDMDDMGGSDMDVTLRSDASDTLRSDMDGAQNPQKKPSKETSAINPKRKLSTDRIQDASA